MWPGHVQPEGRPDVCQLHHVRCQHVAELSEHRLFQMWDGVDSSWLCEGGQLQPDIPRLLPQGGLPPGQ